MSLGGSGVSIGGVKILRVDRFTAFSDLIHVLF